MAISRDEVLHVAGLARLELTDEEVERFREQLNAILEAVGKVAELDLSDVEPTAHPLDLVNAWANDEPRPSLSVEEALANAPTATAISSASPRGEKVDRTAKRHAPGAKTFPSRGPSLVSVPVGAFLRPPWGLGRGSA